MSQTTLRLESAMESSKAVSYNGDIRDAYRAYQQSGDRQTLYSRVYAYFSQNFSRDANFKAVFLTFNDHADMLYYYADSFRANTYRLSQHFRTDVQPQVETTLDAVDTGIYFLKDGSELYMTRNLLDAAFHPYAQLTLLCDTDTLFQPLAALAVSAQVEAALDNVPFQLSELPDAGADRLLLSDYSADFGGHTLSVTVTAPELRLWGAMPELRWAVALVLLLGYLLVKRQPLRFSDAPWYVYLVGAMGIGIVATSSWCTLHVGASAFMALSTAGQLVSSALIDRFGLFGMPVTRIRRRQLPGYALVLLGVILVVLN